MKKRTLIHGQKVMETPESVQMTINSKCPKKWIFVDMETGDVWVHWSRFPSKENPRYTFYRADKKAIQGLIDIAIRFAADKIKEL